jgi:hypothetical protein
VRGLSVISDGDKFISCGDDKTIKLWSTDFMNKEIITRSLGNSATKEEVDEDMDVSKEVFIF